MSLVQKQYDEAVLIEDIHQLIKKIELTNQATKSGDVDKLYQQLEVTLQKYVALKKSNLSLNIPVILRNRLD